MKDKQNSLERWFLDPESGIRWDIRERQRLPHSDEIEMSGRRVALIVRYGADAHGNLVLSRRVIWPQLRTIPNNTHASLRMAYAQEEGTPEIRLDGRPLGAEQPQTFRLDGCLTIQSTTEDGLQIARTIFPSPTLPAAIENWTITNQNAKTVRLEFKPLHSANYARGTKGVYILEVRCDPPPAVTLQPGEQCRLGISFSGRITGDHATKIDHPGEESGRREFAARISHALRFECPDPVLSRIFDFAKLRTTESIYETIKGLMHGPGGDAYYAAVWCNDQCEYANPFFAFLGDVTANAAALNSYRLYMPFMGPEYTPIPSSIVAEGLDIWEGAGDRGDAAMYAYGAVRFALALGDRAVAEELWPAIQWCLEYCRRKMTPQGVIASDSDELEGRFSHGKTNLATSCLTYSSLRSAADLARELGHTADSAEYARRAEALAGAIEEFFGANINGFATYRYHEGLDHLRSWICLPLVMGFTARKEGTIAALLSPLLWTSDGLRTDAKTNTFWDRSTLYGLRGIFCAGDTEAALAHFEAYSRRRLLGEHVPYPVEAYPEGNQRHLAAESALYCRVVTEGIFGITPVGFRSFRCAPRLPVSWDQMALRSIRMFGRVFDLVVRRTSNGTVLEVWRENTLIVESSLAQAGEVLIDLP